MALSRAAYRRLPDLYTVGKEVELRDGTVMWLQVMNPFERDEATHDASVVRSRLMLALKDNPDSEERTQLRSMFVDQGRDGVTAVLVEAKQLSLFVEVMDELRVEEEWRDKVDLLERTDDLASVPSETEREFLLKLQEEFALELARRLESAIAVERDILNECSEDELYDKYTEWWIEQRGGSLALAEYRLTEMWYAARACVGVKDSEGNWDHTSCEGHVVRVFDSKDEVKHLPEGLQMMIIEELASLEISERDAKKAG